MSAKKPFPLIFFAIFLLASCSPTEQALETRSGTEGIAIAFLSNLPREIIVTGATAEKVSLFVQLQNKGAYPERASPEGSIWLSGFDPRIITMQAETTIPFTAYPPRLEGKSGTSATGGQDTYEFEATINANSLPEGKYAPTLLANVCYRYKTIANPLVCIERESFAPSSQKKACSSADVSLSSQGAPVAVTKVETISTADKAQFRIEVKNVGRGAVISPFLSCAPSTIRALQRYDMDIITIEKVSIGDNALSCNAPEGKVRLIEGMGSFTCSLDKSSIPQEQAAFSTPLEIVLAYLYKDSIEQPLVITKVSI